MWPRRGHLEIMAKILEVVSHGGATKTSIVYKANLNFALAQKYLEHLESKGVVVRSPKGGGTVYRLTPKGVDALDALRKTLDVLMEENGTAD